MRIGARAGLLALVLSGSGCGYGIGFRGPEGVRSVFVPMFRYVAFPLRRDFEYELTAAVKREIELRTPLALRVSESGADATLEGTIERYDESALAEGPYDRVTKAGIAVRVGLVFRDARSGEVYYTGPVEDRVTYSIGRGEDGDVARREAIRDIAARIVMVLEPWGDAPAAE
ncbi:MAG: hypothetical protein JXP34_20940 [Planctomycetes bacterium]|nr:hypothetical protein [Planctomycetota bacterium]